MNENIVLLIIGLNILMACAITYLCVKTYYMEKFLDGVPSKSEIINEIIQTKIQLPMGPDGQPVLPGTAPTAPQERNPLVG